MSGGWGGQGTVMRACRADGHVDMCIRYRSCHWQPGGGRVRVRGGIHIDHLPAARGGGGLPGG
eukprot:225101-Chlamydomonas_euryale.AAC.6